MALQQPVGAQVAQNAPGAIQAAPPRADAPMSFADLTARLQPAVVNISTTQRVQVGTQGRNPFAGTPFEEMFRGFGGGSDQQGRPITREATSLGSGFVISADGYIVTNNHVISGDPRDPRTQGTVESITVTLPDRREFTARVVGKDPASDLALLKIDAQNLPFVQFGDSTRTRVGDWVVAIGNPFALGGTVTAGIVSAIHRNIGQGGAYDRYIQTDAAINQGNSGGPMFDLRGNVVGINTAIFSPTGGNVGIGFAIPAEQAKPVIDALMKGGKVRRGYLGVGIQPMTDDLATSLGLPKNRGEIVSRVEPGYAAARAGIQQGDVIMKVNGVEVTPDETLSYIVANVTVGSRIPIELIRNGKTISVTATVGERPPEDQLAANTNNFSDDDDDDDNQTPSSSSTETGIRAALGITVQPLTPQIAQQLRMPPTTRGVVVGAVDPSSDAASDLRRGDVILSINNQPTTTTAAVAQAVAAARAANKASVALLVQRGPNPPFYLGVKLAKPAAK
nr:Do family serine endopeptidase [Sphingomonas quercus]